MIVGKMENEFSTRWPKLNKTACAKNYKSLRPFMLELLYIPSKRRYQCEDPFFSEGDIALRATWLQKQDSQLTEYWDTIRDEIIATQQ